MNKDEMLTITFTNGPMMHLNIASPQTIYMRNIEQKKPVSQLNGIGAPKNGERITSNQQFAQSNGQIIEITSDRITSKSIWEYFLE